MPSEEGGEVLTSFYFGILVHAEHYLNVKKIKIQILSFYFENSSSSNPGCFQSDV